MAVIPARALARARAAMPAMGTLLAVAMATAAGVAMAMAIALMVATEPVRSAVAQEQPMKDAPPRSSTPKNAPGSGQSITQSQALLPSPEPRDTSLIFPGETHFARLRQITFGGQNAEAYYSSDGRQLIFQSTRDSWPCDQIYRMNVDGSGVRRLSDGKGRCTCSYFAPDGKSIIYASTFEASDSCPPPPDNSKGYVWAVHPTFVIYSARPDGRDLRPLSHAPGYNAECVYSPDGRRILFTSDRDGDLDLYTMDPDGSHVRRITHTLGYDGGGFFSPDGKRIVFRAQHFDDTTSAEAREYRALLRDHLVRPSHMEIFVCDADGGHMRQITHNGAANFGPFWHPDGHRIIYASNVGDPKGRNFDLYMIRDDGTGEERITNCPEFDAFPMFSPDARHLVFASNRNGSKPHETNIFIADWKD